MRQPHNYTKTGILKALGLMIVFVSVVFLLAPFTAIFPIAFGMVELFGFSFYYLFLPIAIAFGCVLTAKGKLEGILSWKFYVGALLVLLGAGFIFGYVSRCMTPNNNFGEILKTYADAFANEGGSFIGKIECGCGLFYCWVVDLLCMIAEPLEVTVAVILVLSGLFVMFSKYILKGIANIRIRAGNANAKRQSEKEIERRTEEYKKAFQQEKASNSTIFENPFSDSGEKGAKQETPVYEKPLPSRFVANHEHPKSDIAIPEPSNFVPQTPNNISQSQMSKSGLRNAVFTFGDEPIGEPEKPKPLNENPLFNPFASIEPEPIEEKRPAKPEPVPPAVEEPKEEPMFIDAEIAEPQPLKKQKPEPIETAVEEELDQNGIDDLLDEESGEGREEPMFIDEPEEPVPAPKPAPVAAPVSAPAPKTVSADPELSAEEKTLRDLHQEKAKPLPPYEFPPLDLLKVYENEKNEELIKQNCEENVTRINRVMENLKVGAHVVGYTVGPSVTRYNIQTDDDVSVGAISKVIKDICIRLGGQAVRFEEIVRGQDTSGLEIPNAKSTIVSLKEMMSGMSQDPKDNMMIPFGVSISGECVCSDLSKFPHMMVAGTTGSGKSIFMHGLIMSLIMRNRPEDCQIVLVDPKRVEMSKYKDLPHLLCPIIKEPSEAKVCMDKLIEEMDRRYRLFEFAGCRDIRSFNSDYAAKNGVKKLPFIVVFIDEYADLVDTCKNIGEPVVRIAQKARAAGIHLVIATQRPSVQVITGTIKANIPVRVALSMSSATDSITIINQGGAEDLVGHGDMLIDCSLIARVGFTRAQGCLVLDDEIERVVDFIKSQGLGTMYNENFLDLVDHEEEARIAEANAPQIDAAAVKAQSNQDFYETVKSYVMTQEYTSISKIQRYFSVGFPRAGKLFQQLQADGIVAMQPDSPSSAKGCRVLIKVDENADLSGIKLGSDN